MGVRLLVYYEPLYKYWDSTDSIFVGCSEKAGEVKEQGFVGSPKNDESVKSKILDDFEKSSVCKACES